jgi:hypothetical protein
MNNGQLTLNEGGKTKLDVDPFPVNMLKFGQKNVLVRTDQASTMKGKNAIFSDDLRNRMMKPKRPEAGVWKENIYRKPAKKVKSMSSMLIEKYVRQQQEREQPRWSGHKRRWSPDFSDERTGMKCFRNPGKGWQPAWSYSAPTRGYGAPSRFQPAWVVRGTREGNPVNQEYVDSMNQHGGSATLLCGGEGSQSRNCMPEEDNSVMVGSIICRVSSEVHVNGRCEVGVTVRKEENRPAEVGQAEERSHKRTQVVLSAGHEVVRPGYMMLANDYGRQITCGEEQRADHVTSLANRGTEGQMGCKGVMQGGSSLYHGQK